MNKNTVKLIIWFDQVSNSFFSSDFEYIGARFFFLWNFQNILKYVEERNSDNIKTLKFYEYQKFIAQLLEKRTTFKKKRISQRKQSIFEIV